MSTVVPTGAVPGVSQPVTRLLLGTMIVNSDEQDRGSALLDAAFEHGIRALDTAHGYGGGKSERGIGNWLRERQTRDAVVILSKGGHPAAGKPRITQEDIASDLDDSLERLGVDHIDIYLLHRDNPEVPVGEIVEWLNEHHKAGRIGAFGGSNWTHERLAAANAYASEHDLLPFTASSPHFSLADQVENPWGPGCTTLTGEAMRPAREWYSQEDMPAFAYSSLARGLFSGRITPENYADMADGACQKAYCHPENFERLDRARQLGAEKELSVAQIALAYVLNYPLNLFALIGAANDQEIAQCVAASQVVLSPDELSWLNLERDEKP